MWKLYELKNNEDWEEIAECNSLDNVVKIIEEVIFKYKCEEDETLPHPEFKIISNFNEN